MNVRQDIIDKYKHILYNFFNQHRITDQDIRQDLLLKYYKIVENFDHLKNNSIEAYIGSSLKKIWKRYWFDFYKKENINMKLYSSLNEEEKKQWELAISIDKSFHPGNEPSCPEIIISFISLLTLRQQELIALVFYKGFNFKEAAVRMGSTKQNISKMWNNIQYMFKNFIVVDFGSQNSQKLMKLE